MGRSRWNSTRSTSWASWPRWFRDRGRTWCAITDAWRLTRASVRTWSRMGVVSRRARRSSRRSLRRDARALSSRARRSAARRSADAGFGGQRSCSGSLRRDVLLCPSYGGRMKAIAEITDKRVARTMLEHVGFPSDAPKQWPAREPPELVGSFGWFRRRAAAGRQGRTSNGCRVGRGGARAPRRERLSRDWRARSRDTSADAARVSATTDR